MLRLIRTGAVAMSFIVGAVVYGSTILAAGDDNNDDLTATQWEIERKVFGAPRSSYESEPGRDIEILTYHKDWYELDVPQSGKHLVFKYKCDPKKMPKHFDVWVAPSADEAKKKTERKPDAWGIYEIRDGRLWRCYCSANLDRPKAFDVVGHEGYYLTVHKRRDAKR